MIRLENVNKFFNRKKQNEIHVINNTSLEMGDSGLVALLGNSGCGKTTLLNAIGGLDKVNSGNIFINGENIAKGCTRKKDKIRNANIGYIFQNYNLIEDSTVFDNVAISLRLIGIKDQDEIERRVVYILNKVGIDRFRNRPARMLSGGERQRVGIARALVKNPRIVIADEPTGNLDSRNTIEIMNIIKAISRERLVILVTHEREIAEFYASRIVSIVDGKIVDDRNNDHDGNLDYRVDNRIYIRDLPNVQEMKGDGLKVSYYSDNSIKNPDLEIKIVIKSGNIYVETPEYIGDGFDGVELIDDHYKALSKDVYEDYALDEEEMVSKNYAVRYSSVLNPVKMISLGWKKIASYSVIKKLLLLGFVMAAMISTYAASSMAGMIDIKDEEFVTQNQNYVTVKTAKLDVETYQKIADTKGAIYAIPGDASVILDVPIGDYYQTYGQSTRLSGKLAKKNLVDKNALIAGKMARKKNEIVIDKMTADNMFEMESIKMIGIKTYEDLIGREAGLGEEKIEITGVTEQGSPSIYVHESMMKYLLMYTVGEEEELQTEGKIDDWTRINHEDITIVKGKEPAEDYQVMLPSEMEDTRTKVGSAFDQKIDGKELTICGFYKDKYGRGAYYVNHKMKWHEYVCSCKSVVLCTDNKDALIETLQDRKYNAVDEYVENLKAYKKENQKQTMATMTVGFVVLILSLIEMYLMLRSSFLSRIREVGVLRAIGLKKSDIYKMFAGEILVMTTITQVPGGLLMSYIMNDVASAPGIGDMYYMSAGLIVLLIAVMYLFNLCAGLLPVYRTIRKTPAQILSRIDAE